MPVAGRTGLSHCVPESTAKPWEVTRVQRYQCNICPYIYDPAEGDPDNGVPPGTAFEDLPDDWVCPLCQVSKDEFTAID